jgi:hypothetical protein
MEPDEISNPRKTNDRREREAGINMGDVPSAAVPASAPTMSQSQFGKVGSRSRRPTPPADLLKKHYGK